MYKILIALITSIMLITPALSQHRGGRHGVPHYNRGYNHNYNHNHYRSHGFFWPGAIIGGIIGGAVISSCWENQQVYDPYIGQWVWRRVNVC